MDTIGSLVHGLAVALTPGNLLAVLVGSIIGTVIGVLPGLGPTASIALLFPVTIGMDMVPALIMLAGIYYGAHHLHNGSLGVGVHAEFEGLIRLLHGLIERGNRAAQRFSGNLLRLGLRGVSSRLDRSGAMRAHIRLHGLIEGEISRLDDHGDLLHA